MIEVIRRIKVIDWNRWITVGLGREWAIWVESWMDGGLGSVPALSA